MMLRAGFSHRQSTFSLALAHILIILLAFRLDHTGILFLTFILLALCMLLTGVIYFLIYKYNSMKNIPAREEDAGMIQIIMLAIKFFSRKNKPASKPITSLYSLVGTGRQAYFQQRMQSEKESLQHDLLINEVLKIRKTQKRLGGRDLFHKLEGFIRKHHISIKMDAFFDLLIERKLLVRKSNPENRKRPFPATGCESTQIYKKVFIQKHQINYR